MMMIDVDDTSDDSDDKDYDDDVVLYNKCVNNDAEIDVQIVELCIK